MGMVLRRKKLFPLVAAQILEFLSQFILSYFIWDVLFLLTHWISCTQDQPCKKEQVETLIMKMTPDFKLIEKLNISLNIDIFNDIDLFLT